MAVGAIGAVGVTAYDPYIYNTRRVSASSLGSVDRIPDDATRGGVNFISSQAEQTNINPLKKGETADFAGVLMSQMAMSQMRQAQLFGAGESVFDDEAAQAVEA